MPLIPPALFSCCPSSPRPPFNPHGEKGEGGVQMPFFPHPPSPLPHAGEGEFGRPDARRRRAHRRWRLSRSWSRVHDSGPRRRASPRRAEGVWSLSKYSSSHKDWACWAGLHPPSNADALCIIPPRAPRLRVHRTGSRGGAEARRWERSSHKSCWTGLRLSLQAGASRDTALPDRVQRI